ncbi:Uncharacterised ACR, YggU family COG1872 [Klebsiella michiganensis]|nr:Uncharacterised ACR, YggU family COG1872 [Klebsiella michiganensis]
MSAVEACADGLVLRLYIQPKASRDSIVGLHGDELKVAITAPPVDGQANAHLVKFLAKQFRVAKSQVLIEKGELGPPQTDKNHSSAADPRWGRRPERINRISYAKSCSRHR